MLKLLGLATTSLEAHEIDLLHHNPNITHRDIRRAMSEGHNYHYGYLPEQQQEDALHATRLLAVEERPCQRVQRALLSKDSLLRTIPARQQPTPPPDGDEAAPQPTDAEADAFKRQKFREEVLLDFAVLESSILRIQLIQSSNERERERYAAEKAKILETAQAVRDNTVQLREQLEEAQKVLERRKGYDELAGKILDDRKLKSRDDCGSAIETLEKEIEDLQQESAEYDQTWVGRREQFDRVVGEGENMIKLIKGIKDEPEQAEGEGEEEDENMEEGEGDDVTRGEGSRLGTPVPEGRTPMRVDGGETPMPGSGSGGDGGATPAAPVNKFLDVDDATRSSSRAASPSRQTEEATPVADVDMADTAIPPPKDSEGMEASANQVADPAEGAAETMDES